MKSYLQEKKLNKIEQNKANKDGLLILESSIKKYSISPDRIKEYGDTQLTFWRKK